jgi:hypothetical protein
MDTRSRGEVCQIISTCLLRSTTSEGLREEVETAYVTFERGEKLQAKFIFKFRSSTSSL